MAVVTICSDSGAPKIKSVTVSTVSPAICHEVMGPDAMIIVFWMFEFQSNFFTLHFHFHQEDLNSSSPSAIMVTSSVYLRLLIFLPAILIPACHSSSPVFHIMYSELKLNKQGGGWTIYSLDLLLSQF